MTWLYQGKEFINDDPKIFGFVYLITSKIDGKKYIGRKYLSSAGYKTVKGKRKKVRKESDWLDYYGSSPLLKEDVEKHGKENFIREILHLCRSKSACSYLETKEIFDRNALIDEHYYNGWVSCKINGKNLKDLFFDSSKIPI